MKRKIEGKNEEKQEWNLRGRNNKKEEEGILRGIRVKKKIRGTDK